MGCRRGWPMPLGGQTASSPMPFNGSIACEERLDPLRDAFAPKEHGFILATDPLQLLSPAGRVLGGPVTDYARVLQVRQQPAGPYVAEPERALDQGGRRLSMCRGQAPPWHIAGRRLRTATCGFCGADPASMGPALDALTVFKRILSLHGPTAWQAFARNGSRHGHRRIRWSRPASGRAAVTAREADAHLGHWSNRSHGISASLRGRTVRDQPQC